MENYQDTINRVEELLNDNPEWRNRYNDYINDLNSKNLTAMKNARNHFYVPEPFHLYMNLSTAKNNSPSSNTINFELRFHGKSVAEVKFVPDGTDNVELIVKKPLKKLTRAFETAEMNVELDRIISCSKVKNIKWNDENARDFRKIYLELDKKINANIDVKKALGDPEHDLECALLKNFSQKSSVGKVLANIQPVMMGDTNARFQMPTPIKASEAKKGPDSIKYSGEDGGGIDILARIGSGRATKLAVLELKDKYSNSEPPEKVMHQAVAYATFIRELLRSDCGSKWWKFFGFGGNIPSEFEIKALVVMPYDDRAKTDFGGDNIKFDFEKDVFKNDSITLGYIYIADNAADSQICIDKKYSATTLAR